MGYFENCTEAYDYHRTYCQRCVHRQPVDGHRTHCEVWGKHTEMLTEEYKSAPHLWHRTYEDVMNALIPFEDGKNLLCKMFLPVPPKEGCDPGSQLAYLSRSLSELVDLAEGLHRDFEREARQHHHCKVALARCQNVIDQTREEQHKPIDKDLEL